MPTSPLLNCEETTFSAMGTEVHIAVRNGPADAMCRAICRVHQLEAIWSRFLPTSEVSQLTNAAGQWVDVSPETVTLVRRAIEAWQLTGGAFDPTLLAAVEEAGYDRSFEQLSPVTGKSACNVRLAVRRPPRLSTAPVDIEVADDAVRLPAGTGFDPGGIGKGLAADIVASELLARGAEAVLVNLGGDLRVAHAAGGALAVADGWTIAVEHPHLVDPLALLGIRSGGIATSTTLTRRWLHRDVVQHHLIDADTGRPSDSDVAFAVVVTGEAWRAEVLAKAVLLRGRTRAFDLIDERQAASLVVTTDGEIAATDSLRAFTGGVDLPAHVEPDQLCMPRPLAESTRGGGPR